MRKYWAELLVIALAFIALSGMLALITFALMQAANASDPTPQQVSQVGPDISHCFAEGESRDLWDCIRHVD